MGKHILEPEEVPIEEDGNKFAVYTLTAEQLALFNPKILGLGDLRTRSERVEAIAATFDLSGFTEFCSQNDPQLCVPDFLAQFLEWLFDKIREQTIHKTISNKQRIYSNLPFLAKFLGDGVLFLWDTKPMNDTAMCNIVISLHRICEMYKEIFYPKVKKSVVKPPSILRCGIARGSVYSVGNAEDYVGPCINIASRLQKLSTLRFCISRKGFDFEKGMSGYEKIYYLKITPIRGIGDNELVWVLKSDFDALEKSEKDSFKDP